MMVREIDKQKQETSDHYCVEFQPIATKAGNSSDLL